MPPCSQEVNTVTLFEKTERARTANISFFIRVFFQWHWQFTGQQGKGRNHPLFLSTTSTRWQTFRHLSATLHLIWLPRIFNRTACIYETVTRWDLPPCWITVWLIDDVMLISVYFRDDFCLGFLLQQFYIGNLWIWARTNYYLCDTTEPTNQVR